MNNLLFNHIENYHMKIDLLRAHGQNWNYPGKHGHYGEASLYHYVAERSGMILLLYLKTHKTCHISCVSLDYRYMRSFSLCKIDFNAIYRSHIWHGRCRTEITKTQLPWEIVPKIVVHLLWAEYVSYPTRGPTVTKYCSQTLIVWQVVDPFRGRAKWVVLRSPRACNLFFVTPLVLLIWVKLWFGKQAWSCPFPSLFFPAHSEQLLLYLLSTTVHPLP